MRSRLILPRRSAVVSDRVGGGVLDFEPQAGCDADRTEHAQVVFAEALGGVADGSQHAALEVFATTDVVDDARLVRPGRVGLRITR